MPVDQRSGGAAAGTSAAQGAAPVITAIVLAAGTSSRLGRPKQLLDLDGSPVLQHVIDLASRCFDEIVLVLGHEAHAIEAALDLPDAVRVVVNRDYELGQSTSLRTGLSHVSDSADAVAILLGDQPRLDEAVVRRVVEVFGMSDRPVARPRFRGGPGHPVLVARRAFPLAAGARGDVGLRGLFSRGEVEDVEVDEEVPIDVDTWESYERLTKE